MNDRPKAPTQIPTYKVTVHYVGGGKEMWENMPASSIKEEDGVLMIQWGMPDGRPVTDRVRLRNVLKWRVEEQPPKTEYGQTLRA